MNSGMEGAIVNRHKTLLEYTRVESSIIMFGRASGAHPKTFGAHHVGHVYVH